MDSSRWSWLIRNKNGLFVLIIPMLLSPLIAYFHEKEVRAAFLVLLMSTYWITEVMPIYVTSLLPIIFAPPMGLLTASEVSREYMSDVNMLFVGGAFMAIATQYRNLHRRIGIKLMRLMGTDFRMLMLGLMVPTWFLSMWMSNSATAIMMLTIVEALVTRLNQSYNDLPDEHQNENINTFAAGLGLGVCFASSIGGITTLIGTPTNLVFYDYLKRHYGDNTNVNFATWIIYALPISILLLFVTWLVIGLHIIGFNYSEKNCSFVLLLVIILWISRDPGAFGWSNLLPKYTIGNKTMNYVSDTQPAMLGAFMLLLLPSQNPFKNKIDSTDQVLLNIINPSESVLPWNIAVQNCPWEVVVLTGGGFALSKIFSTSGLSYRVCQSLEVVIQFMNLPAIVATIICLTTVITTFVSNVAVVTILLPISFDLARHIDVNPLYCALPLTIACSFSLVLPASTPANAITYNKGWIKLSEMATTGTIICIVGLVLLLVSIFTYSVFLFELDKPLIS